MKYDMIMKELTKMR